MEIINKIDDKHTIRFAKKIGFSYPEDNVPPLEEHEAAIRSWAGAPFEKINAELVKEDVYTDPEVIAKQSEYDALLAAKLDAAKPKTEPVGIAAP